ncbi:unnamed protein product [Miscanthus lutarioriparius]|uniref:Uncharacterized protein n=1 Tax=Miscanthus lutarioriparius TaxID=422564 RepID=A0A811PZV3_9POAL|nr:unnamed protein product [Miscanthus lutarioriparius]
MGLLGLLRDGVAGQRAHHHGDRAGHLRSCGDGEPEQDRCKKVAERVRCLKDILKAAQDGTTTAAAAAADAAATRRLLLDRLEEALGRALQVVRRCQRSCSRFLRSVIVVVVAGGRMADPLDGVEAESDRCILDLAVANSLRIARLETLLVRQQHTVTVAASTGDSSEKDDENKSKKKQGSADVSVPDKMMDHDNTTATTIGVPVCTVTAAVHEHKHEMVPPPSYEYGYGYGYRSYHSYCRNHGCACDCGCWDDNAAFYHTQYSSYPSMFSDDNPNSCSISCALSRTSEQQSTGPDHT